MVVNVDILRMKALYFSPASFNQPCDCILHKFIIFPPSFFIWNDSCVPAEKIVELKSYQVFMN